MLLERSAYDQDGNYQSATFMDYLLPTACEIPRIEIEHLETVPLDADVNFRGVGEGGMIVAPPTLVNAIEDALTPFGVRIYEQHLPPARILELIARQAEDEAPRLVNRGAGRRLGHGAMPGASRPRARPRSTASWRLWTPSLAYRWRVWVPTVWTERNSSLAISRAVRWVGR